MGKPTVNPTVYKRGEQAAEEKLERPNRKPRRTSVSNDANCMGAEKERKDGDVGRSPTWSPIEMGSEIQREEAYLEGTLSQLR